MRWQLHEAKQRVSKLVRSALQDGPQIVTRHGQEIVVVAADEYRSSHPDGPDFGEFLLTAPDLGILDFERSGAPARDAGIPN